MALAVAVTVAALPSVSARAGDEWRLALGFYEPRWHTSGAHGRPADCRSHTCDDHDFRRANLDNGIGVRVGAERPVWWGRGVEVLAGGEFGLLKSEYNTSQRDFHMADAVASVGATTTGSRLRALARAGAGVAVTSDGRGGPALFGEVGFETTLGSAAAMRLTVRRARRAGPSSSELTLALISRPAVTERARGWEVSWALGATAPGLGPGGDLGLGRAGVWQLGAHRQLSQGGWRLGFLVGAVDHESVHRRSRAGVPGNQRGKVIAEVAARLDREVARLRSASLSLGGGVRAASFEDDDALLVANDGTRVEGGLALAPFCLLQVRQPLSESLDVFAGVEQAYWPACDLGELRLRIGVVVHP